MQVSNPANVQRLLKKHIMGMDIFLVEYLGKNKNGYLKTRDVGKEFDWDDTRMPIRHRLNNQIEMKELHSGIYGDLDALYRPVNFDDAFGWANSLTNEHDKKYVKRILEILKLNENLYLEFSY